LRRNLRGFSGVVNFETIAGRNPLHHSIENLLPILSLIETEITEVVQKAARLRGDLGVDSGDVSRERIRRAGVVSGFKPKPGIPVANRREADTVDRRILRLAGHRLDAGAAANAGFAFAGNHSRRPDGRGRKSHG
jgi:hypothetical protein